MSQENLAVVNAAKLLVATLPEAERLEVMRALIQEGLSEDARWQLLQILPPGGAAVAVPSHMPQVNAILRSLEVTPDGRCKLIIPACLSDISAMRSLNVYFQATFSYMNRNAIYQDDLTWYADQPGVKSRDISKPRTINIKPIVDGTAGFTRSAQENMLAKAKMEFAAPEEVALVVAAHACITNGEDLLNGLSARTAASGVALTTVQNCGVYVCRHDDASGYSDVVASGVALPANS